MKRLFPLLLILLLAAPAFGGSTTDNLGLYKPAERENDWATQVNDNFNVLDRVLAGVDSQKYGTLLEAATAAQATTGKRLWITTDYTISADTTIPSDVIVVPVYGSVLTVSSGYTLTTPAPQASPAQQVFDGDGSVVFNNGSVAYPEWWETNTTPGTTDMTVAIQAAVDAYNAGGGKVKFARTRYKVTSQIDIGQDGLLLEGVGWTASQVGDGTYIEGSSVDGYIFYVGTGIQEVVFRDMAIYGDGSADEDGGIFIGHNSQYGEMHNVLVQNCTNTNAAGITFGSATEYSWGWRLYNVRVYSNYNGVEIMHNNDDIQLFGCEITNNNNYGLYVERATNIGVYGGDYQSNRVRNISIAGAINMIVSHIYTEASYGGSGTYGETEVNNHRTIYIEQYDSTNAADNVVITGLYGYFGDGTYFADYAIEIANSSLVDGEISNSSFWKVNTAFVKNGTGNSGKAFGNNLRNEGTNESNSWSTLFDSEEGWNVETKHIGGTQASTTKAFSQSSDFRRIWATSSATTALLTFSPTADYSYMVEAYVLFRRSGAAATNGYRIFAIVERDGSSAPTIIGQTNDAHEDVAGDSCAFAVSGNDIVLNYVASGTGGNVHFRYKIIGMEEPL